MIRHRFLLSASAAALCVLSTLNPCAALELTVVPARSVVDRVVETTVRAPAGSIVTVRLTMPRFGLSFESQATFRVPASGIVRLSDDAPISGSYRGTDPMGLFWSALPNGAAPKPLRPAPDGELASRPFNVTASIGSQTAVAEGVRLVVADNVVRHTVDSPGLVATLFQHEGTGCHPGVIVLGGSEGGVPNEEAAVLASHDLTTLADAYFGAPGLSRSLTNVPIEIVERALSFMRKQPSVCPGEIALFGGSKGAELALIAASRFERVRAVVAMKPASVVFSGLFGNANRIESSWSYRGTPLPFANGIVPREVQKEISEGEASHQKVAYSSDYLARVQNNTDPAAIIAVETIQAPILLIAGGSDHLWPSAYMAQQIMLRRKSMNPGFADRLLLYPDAGHFIGIPFEFAESELAHSPLDVGGSAEADEQADEESWPLAVRFLGGRNG